MVYITMTGSLESLPSSTAAPAQRGRIRGKEERQDDGGACRVGSSRLEVLK
jgi:hypothetical protein